MLETLLMIWFFAIVGGAARRIAKQDDEDNDYHRGNSYRSIHDTVNREDGENFQDILGRINRPSSETFPRFVPNFDFDRFLHTPDSSWTDIMRRRSQGNTIEGGAGPILGQGSRISDSSRVSTGSSPRYYRFDLRTGRLQHSEE